MSALPAGKDIGEFVELQFKAGFWEKGGIPERGCWRRQSALERILEQRGAYEMDDLIHGLMDWLDVTDAPEPALETLRQLLDRHYPADGRDTARCRFVDEHSVDRIFHAGQILLDQPLVTWQRRDWIIAAAQPGRRRNGCGTARSTTTNAGSDQPENPFDFVQHAAVPIEMTSGQSHRRRLRRHFPAEATEL